MRILKRFGWLLVGLMVALVTTNQVLAASYTVTIDDTQFVPSTLKVKVGDSITFINTTDATQSAKTSSTTGFNTGDIGPGGSKSVTVNTAGTFSYTSAYNSALEGTVTVEGTATASPTPSPTATTSATTKGGQEMPVSGTAEVLLAMIVGGGAMVATGLLFRNGQIVLPGRRSELVDLPKISPYNNGDEQK